jgi:hypothetical protein
MNTAPDPTFLRFEKWFISAQDRAGQWFTTQTRIITVIASIIAAFVLQLDGFELIHRISSNPDLRSKLVANAENLQKDAERVFQNATVGTQDEHKKMIDELRTKHPEIGSELDNRPDYIALGDVDQWMREKLKGKPNGEEIVADYNQIFARKKLDSAGLSFEKINNDFKKTGIDLLPQPYPHIVAKDWTWSRFWRLSGEWSSLMRRLLGILLSAALLSLGAPFWFNTLKSLTDLRPKLAQQIDENPQRNPPTPASKQ